MRAPCTQRIDIMVGAAYTNICLHKGAHTPMYACAALACALSALTFPHTHTRTHHYRLLLDVNDIFYIVPVCRVHVAPC